MLTAFKTSWFTANRDIVLANGVRRDGHIAKMEETNAQNILVGKCLGRCALGRPRQEVED
jgi:hypothetical protein